MLVVESEGGERGCILFGGVYCVVYRVPCGRNSAYFARIDHIYSYWVFMAVADDGGVQLRVV